MKWLKNWLFRGELDKFSNWLKGQGVDAESLLRKRRAANPHASEVELMLDASRKVILEMYDKYNTVKKQADKNSEEITRIKRGLKDVQNVLSNTRKG